MRRCLIACTCSILAAACSAKPGGREIARLTGTPLGIQKSDDGLIVLVTDPNEDVTSDDYGEHGLHAWLVAVSTEGGTPKQLARLPLPGDYDVGPLGIAYATKNMILHVDKNGSVSKLAEVKTQATSPAWLNDSVLAVTFSVEEPCCQLVRVSLDDGSVATLGLVQGSRAIFAGDAAGTYVADADTSSEQTQLLADGKLSEVPSETGGLLVCFAATKTHLWWGRLGADMFTLTTAPKMGGSPVKVDEFPYPAQVECSPGDDELVYTRNHKIFRVAAGQKPRLLAESKQLVRGLHVNGSSVYWAESVGKEWSIRTTPLR